MNFFYDNLPLIINSTFFYSPNMETSKIISMREIHKKKISKISNVLNNVIFEI